MPPNVADIKTDQDRAYVDLQRDAEAFRCIGQAGWVLMRCSTLEGLQADMDRLAGMMATLSHAMRADNQRVITVREETRTLEQGQRPEPQPNSPTAEDAARSKA
jgi:hypothetical protein